MTAPDPQRAVAEARAWLMSFRSQLDPRTVRAFYRAIYKLETVVADAAFARLLATQDDADAQAPGYYTEGRR
ncbi:MAG TPA: hypothetical protein VF030_06875 [Solirubrobacterales bacterium]